MCPPVGKPRGGAAIDTPNAQTLSLANFEPEIAHSRRIRFGSGNPGITPFGYVIRLSR
ncbi:hypothetical protein BN2476_170087 [Paraburkholderia piptadeniae]|uniref:Uncharacterized protein n=1 Tax=Paraburkholderia piptadeniae TaxID=1701573 RepID=A0A1N7RTC7_9BURK|nr:hypothetical protein BN2476_170087 [Paraburkholderia piptadeniae]